MDGAVNWFLDSVDDPLLPDQIPDFSGGQFSNLRANLLQPNASKLLGNCDIEKLGKLRTRRGTIIIGPAPNPQPDPGVTTVIQGLTSYQTKDYNYIVAAHNGKIWKFDGVNWVRIATGGAADNDDIVIFRTGLINQPAVPAGFTMGTTVLVVDGMTGFVAAGEKLYFVNNLKNAYYEYTIASVTPAAPAATTGITLEEPGLVFDVGDNWAFMVARTAKINHAAYAGGYAGALTIDNFTGPVNAGEIFVIKSENVTHKVTTHTETAGNTTSIDTWQNFNQTTGTFGAGALQVDYVATNATDPIVFAQGDDKIFFCDGVGPIYAWNGKTLMNLSSSSALDYMTGSAYTLNNTLPPVGPHILLWFQNRLIASGITAEPDAIYFSDFFDATSWDHNYQKVRIGGGESDPITGLLAWTDLNMLVYKKNSCYLINLDPTQNPDPNDPTLLVASFAIKQLHKLIGCPAPRSAIQVGGGSTTPGSDVLFVDGDKKVHSIRRVIAAETQQEVGQAVSLPIQDVMDTINIDHIDRCVAMYHNEHYLLGIPSTLAVGGDRNNGVVAYNLLTQSWCGVWSWAPTCFARRTDLGSYSKLIFGDYQGNVVQWLDDLSLDEETETTYKDYYLTIGSGRPIATSITTRAITFGDAYSYKTGLNVEFEFDESEADHVTVKVVLDKVLHPTLIEVPFSTLSENPLRLPFTLPVVLNQSASLLRKAFDLQRYGTWRELQFFITSESGKLAIRSIRVTGFMDTIQLQTLRFLPVPDVVVTGGTPPDELVQGDDGLTVTTLV